MVHQLLEHGDVDPGVGVALGVGVPVGVGEDLRLVERQHLRHRLAVRLQHGRDVNGRKVAHPLAVQVAEPAVRDAFASVGVLGVRGEQLQLGGRGAGESLADPFLLVDDECRGGFGDGQPPAVAVCFVVVVDEDRFAVCVSVEAVQSERADFVRAAAGIDQ